MPTIKPYLKILVFIAISACSCETTQHAPKTSAAPDNLTEVTAKKALSYDAIKSLPKIDHSAHKNLNKFMKKADVRKDIQEFAVRYQLLHKASRTWALTSEAGWADDGQTLVFEYPSGPVESFYFRNIKKGITPKNITSSQFDQFKKEVSLFSELTDYRPEVFDSLRYEITYFELNKSGKFTSLKRVYMNNFEDHEKKDDYLKVVSAFKNLR